MKKTVKLLFLILSCVFIASCSDKYNDSFIKSEIADIKTDLSALKKQVSSIQTLVDALNSGKVITEVKELGEGNGYHITFNDGSKIFVRDGKDGVNGTNGINGKDGINGANGKNAPIIGIGESDGHYYWTLTTDGKTEFLLNKQGQKLPVSGIDGKDGKDGTNGKDGATPELIIDEAGFWVVNGERLQDQEGKPIKATGESLFQEVKNEEENVIFILTNGEEIIIPKSEVSHLRFKEKEGSTTFFLQTGRPNKLAFEASKDISNIEVINKPANWTAIVHIGNRTVDITIPRTVKYAVEEVKIQGIDKNGLTYVAIAKIMVQAKDYDDPEGIFILNEGNMTTENGSLIYITPNGEVRDRAYYNANGRELGNVTQDMFIYHDKIYIISQNGSKNAVGLDFENEGKLVVANAKTLKKEAAYDEELAGLNWPSHIAVLNEENIFIRDNKGVHLFNSKSGSTQFIENSSGASKNRMVVTNHKVFVPAGNNIFVLEANQNQVAKTIKMEGSVTGVIPTDDGNIYVSTTGTKQLISKIDSKTLEIIKVSEVTEGKLGAGWGASPAISAKGNLIYYSNAGFEIYRHNFETGESAKMVNVKDHIENAGIVYNNLGVQPITGEVYMNTIKAYGWDFLINDISVYNPSEGGLSFRTTYQNYTHFPAGIYFRANFAEASAK